MGDGEEALRGRVAVADGSVEDSLCVLNQIWSDIEIIYSRSELDIIHGRKRLKSTYQ
jgi:hypothetical protein